MAGRNTDKAEYSPLPRSDRPEDVDADESRPLSIGTETSALMSGVSINALSAFNAVAPLHEERSSTEGGQVREATVASSIINLANTILGAGMLGLPYAVSVCGLLFGMTMLVLSALGSMFGLYLLVLCSDYCKEPSSYYVCAKKTFPQVGLVIDVVVFIKCFGVAISYLVVVGDNMTGVAAYFIGHNNDSILLSRLFWIGLSSLMIVPLSFLPTLNKLRFTSSMALVSVGYLFCIVIVQYFVYKGKEGSPVPPPQELCLIDFNLRFLKIMTIFVFGFTCHQNVFTIYNELIDPSLRRMRTIIGSSISSGWTVYFFVALFGYLTFGSGLKDNILKNYEDDDVSIMLARLFVSVLVIFSYPLQSHPARICLDNIYRIAYEYRYARPASEQTRRRYVVETLLILAGTYGIGLTGIDLADVLSLVGAVGSTTMCYILPGLFYLKFTWDRRWTGMQIVALMLMIVGIFVMPTAIVFTFVDPAATNTCLVPLA